MMNSGNAVTEFTAASARSTAANATAITEAINGNINERQLQPTARGSGGANLGRALEKSAPEPQRKSVICRYFLRGLCRYGENCHFSHDTSAAEVMRRFERPTTSVVVAACDDNHKNWIDAPVFVPGTTAQQQKPAQTVNVWRSTATTAAEEHAAQVALDGGTQEQRDKAMAASILSSDYIYSSDINSKFPPSLGAANARKTTRCFLYEPGSINEFCPYTPPCPFGIFCIFALHMLQCRMCDQYCLHPNDPEQRRRHHLECVKQHEQAMEYSFAIARSKDKVCGICYDVILSKSSREKRFGILPNCTHVFCLECIRKWRQEKSFEFSIVRSCPECRVPSDYVFPSAFWIESKEEKDKILSEYHAALGKIDCKYFKKGEGTCPFGNKCFYRHALPNGNLVDVGTPSRMSLFKRLRALNEQRHLAILSSYNGGIGTSAISGSTGGSSNNTSSTTTTNSKNSSEVNDDNDDLNGDDNRSNHSSWFSDS